MDRIREFLRDPGWWFTAILAGVVVSLLASYLRDLIAKAAAAVSTSQRKRNELRSRELAEKAHAIAADGIVLVLENIRALAATVIFFDLGVLFVLLTLLFFGPLRPPVEAADRNSRLALLLLVALAMLGIGPVLSRRFRLLKEAFHIYLRRNHEKHAA